MKTSIFVLNTDYKLSNWKNFTIQTNKITRFLHENMPISFTLRLCAHIPHSSDSLKIRTFFTNFVFTYRNLSVVKLMPWKLVKQWVPWTSSQTNLNLRNERSASFSFCKSANETSYTRCFKPSDAIFVPCVRLTNVFPTWRWANIFGALISYQSLRENGSITFFLEPFLPPLLRPLFFPTAMLIDRKWKRQFQQTHGSMLDTDHSEVGHTPIHHGCQHQCSIHSTASVKHTCDDMHAVAMVKLWNDAILRFTLSKRLNLNANWWCIWWNLVQNELNNKNSLQFNKLKIN